ncbi:MAG: hypothetical protein HOP10_07235 [Chitinophagaceae bacterium]|nr:hypothetical protein [Chitinophagaceae bacterium]
MKKILSYNLLIGFILFFLAGASAQRVNINLRINENTEAIVFQNEAVLLDVAVFNKKAQADNRWNQAGEERMKELDELLRQGKIKQEDYDREKASIEKSKRVPQSTELGSATSSWTSAISWKVMNTANRNYVDIPVKLLKRPSTDGKAVLDANGYYIACYGISPEDMRSVGPGTYAIECVINNIPSNAAVLKVENSTMDAAKENSEPVLLRTGQYYWHAENGIKTVEYADRILAKNPSSLDGLSLKGDGQLLQRSYQSAMETYNKAVIEYYKQNGANSEPPEYLLSMIDIIRKELGQ